MEYFFTFIKFLYKFSNFRKKIKDIWNCKYTMKDRIFIILDSKEKKLLDCYDDGIFIFEKYFILIYLKININMTFLFLISHIILH